MEQNLIINARNELIDTNIVDYQKKLQEYLKTIPETARTEADAKGIRENLKVLTEIQQKIKTAQDKLFSGELEETKDMLANMVKDIDIKKSSLNKAVKEFRKNLIMDIKSQFSTKINKIEGLNLLTVDVENEVENALKGKRSVDAMVVELKNLLSSLEQEAKEKLSIVTYFENEYLTHEKYIIKSDFDKLVRELVVEGRSAQQITTQINSKIDEIKLHRKNLALQQQIKIQEQQQRQEEEQREQALKERLEAREQKQKSAQQAFTREAFENKAPQQQVDNEDYTKRTQVGVQDADLIELRKIYKYLAVDFKSRHPDTFMYLDPILTYIKQLGAHIKQKREE